MSANHCKHYSTAGLAVQGPTCALGIDIEATFKPCWPCWTGNKPGEASGTCDKFVAPTAEEIAEQDRKANESFARMMLALAAIEQWEKAHGSVMGKVIAISCPCCLLEGALRFTVDRFHLYVECSTPECVKFRGNWRGVRA